MARPRVTVLIPVRKPRLDWLRQAIDSVLAQTFTDFELLVVVDDSESLHDFLAGYDDARIRQLHLVDMPGLPAALNRGIAEAKGDLIARLDADDIAEPERLAQQVAMFDADVQLDVAGSQITIVDADGVVFAGRRYPTAHDAIVRAMQHYDALAHPSVMFRRARIAGAGGYPPRPMEDYDLWCALVVAGMRFANHPSALVRYRYTAGVTRSNVRRSLRATIDIKRRHFGARLTLSARARLLLESLLLWLPAGLVNRLFRMTQFRRPRRG